MIVVDASVVLAAVVDHVSHQKWSLERLTEEPIAPQHLSVEVAHALRRLDLTGELTEEAAWAALEVSVLLDISLWPFAPFVERVWQLRGAVTAYDACYVALAETLDVPLATLDRRLTSAPGPRCSFLTPPSD